MSKVILITTLILTTVSALTAADVAADLPQTDTPAPPLVTLKKSLKVTSRYLVFPTVFIPKVKSLVRVSIDGNPLFENQGTLTTRGQFLWADLDVSMNRTRWMPSTSQIPSKATPISTRRSCARSFISVTARE